MTDLIDRLAHLRGEESPVAAATVAADLARARAARRRRRHVRGAAVGVSLTAVLAVGAGAGALIATHDSGGSPTAAGQDGSHTVALVAYHGKQLPGFVVSKVPAGFTLQGANAFSLAIARPSDHSSIDSFSGKLVVMLQSQDQHGTPAGEKVSVHGHPGTIYSTPDKLARILQYSDGRHVVQVQAWSSLGLSDSQLLDFAEGVTVTSAAQAGVG